MIVELEYPISLDLVLRDVQQDQASSWLSIHDEADLEANTTLLKPIMLEINKIAELRQVFASFNMPYLAFFMDNEYDDHGSFTASNNAHIEMYGMNFKGNKKFIPKPKSFFVFDMTKVEDVKIIEGHHELLIHTKENGVYVSFLTEDGKYTSNLKFTEESVVSFSKSSGVEFTKEEK